MYSRHLLRLEVGDREHAGGLVGAPHEDMVSGLVLRRFVVGAQGRALIERRRRAHGAVRQVFAAGPLADVVGVEQRGHEQKRRGRASACRNSTAAGGGPNVALGLGLGHPIEAVDGAVRPAGYGRCHLPNSPSRSRRA